MSESAPTTEPAVTPAADVPAPAPAPSATLYPPAAPEAAPSVEVAPSVVEGAKPETPVEAPAALTRDSYKIEFPENIKVSDELLGSFKDLALEAKLPPADAQKFASLYTKGLEGQMATLQAQHAENQRLWLSEINAAPEFQGERRTQSLAMLGRAMEEFGSPEAAKILNESGLGNHPAIVKFIYRLAEGHMEGTPVLTGGPPLNGKGGGAKTAGQLFYPSMETQTRN
jgi:hypothetical protein